MGAVTSLNGQAEKGIMLEAIGTSNGNEKNDEGGKRKQPKRYEQATTDVNGEYRLRGLYPGYTYTVKLKESPGKIEKSSPPKHTVKIGQRDARIVDFTLVRSPTKFDLTGTVNASEVWMPDLEVQVLVSIHYNGEK